MKTTVMIWIGVGQTAGETQVVPDVPILEKRILRSTEGTILAHRFSQTAEWIGCGLV